MQILCNEKQTHFSKYQFVQLLLAEQIRVRSSSDKVDVGFVYTVNKEPVWFNVTLFTSHIVSGQFVISIFRIQCLLMNQLIHNFYEFF